MNNKAFNGARNGLLTAYNSLAPNGLKQFDMVKQVNDLELKHRAGEGVSKADILRHIMAGIEKLIA